VLFQERKGRCIGVGVVFDGVNAEPYGVVDRLFAFGLAATFMSRGATSMQL
jgi:hypothetical protein